MVHSQESSCFPLGKPAARDPKRRARRTPSDTPAFQGSDEELVEAT